MTSSIWLLWVLNVLLLTWGEAEKGHGGRDTDMYKLFLLTSEGFVGVVTKILLEHELDS